MSTLRTALIHASNTRALPKKRYRVQQHNQIVLSPQSSDAVQAVRYVLVTKKVVFNQAGKVIASENQHNAAAVWKKGHGAIERLDKKTGEIVHLVQTKNSQINPMARMSFIRVKVPLSLNRPPPSALLPQAVIQRDSNTA